MSDPITTTAAASAVVPAPPQRRTWRRRLLAVLFGLIIAVVLAELALRVIGYSSPVFLRPHPVYGAAFKPGTEGWFRLEGKAWNKINSHGFNGPEWTTAKPANTFRIVVLGDSYTAAQQVEQQDSFCQKLRQDLAASGALHGRNVEVLNCGCNGYGTAQQLLVWREQAQHFQADLVLLAFLPANDFNDNYRPLTIGTLMRPYFEINAAGQLELDNRFLSDEEYVTRRSWLSQLKYFFVDHCRLAQLINTFRLKNSYSAPAAEKPAPEQKPIVETGIGEQAYQTPRGDWIKAWEITRRLIYQLQKEVLDSGAQFGVVCLTIGSQTNPNPQARAEVAKELGMPDLLEPERLLTELCAAAKPPIPLLTLSQGLIKIATEQQVAMHGFGANLNGGHWNQNGHRYAAQLIAEWLGSKPELLESRPETKPK